MELKDITLDVEQHIEVKAAIGDVFKGVLHRFGEGSTSPAGDSMQMILEPWAGGRWFLVGPCAGDQAAHVAGVERSDVHVVSGGEPRRSTVRADRRRHQSHIASSRNWPLRQNTPGRRGPRLGALSRKYQEGLFVRNGSSMPDDLDPIFKALSDPTRRAILDLLRAGPRTTTEIVDTFPKLSRFGVMKHMDVLRHAGLIQTREDGRQRVNSLNAVPIRQIYERWVSNYQELWVDKLLRLKDDFEGPKT
jgi:DNA-binding transcriptional ArsR family regulator